MSGQTKGEEHMNERDKTAHMMQASAGNSWGTEAHFQQFADLIRADEREAILKLADSLGWIDVDRIKARGNT
jgi:hypothetical protein